MPTLEILRKDMFLARKNGDVEKANILSLAIASILNFKIEVQREITQDDIVSILRKEEKKLKEAFEQFSTNGRDDLAQREKLQLEVIKSYLPSLMSTEEVEGVVKAKLATMSDVTPRDMGKIMGMMMSELKGKADGNVVSDVVKKLLTQE